MSKLRQHLDSTVFPVRALKAIKPIMEYVDVRSHIDNTHYDEQLAIDTRMHISTCITYELLTDSPGIRSTVIGQMKDAIIEEVFGEFRKPLRDLRLAIYRNDEVKALKILNNLMDQMYNEA